MKLVLKKILASLGAGAAEVDTVLHQSEVQPGGMLRGEVALHGGSVAQNVQEIQVELVARVEVEAGDSEFQTDVAFYGTQLTDSFELDAEGRHAIPFECAVPLETPITTMFGQHLRGMAVGIRTVVAVESAVDRTDLDPVTVTALPAQQAILDAISRLGFRFARADLEQGRLHAVPQTLPFYQEIEFAPPRQFARALNQLEVTFVARPDKMDIVLEADKRGGLFTEGRDTFGHFSAEYATADRTDWAGQLEGWLTEVGRRRGLW